MEVKKKVGLGTFDTLVTNLSNMIHDGIVGCSMEAANSLAIAVYIEVMEYESEPDVYGLSMDDEGQDFDTEGSTPFTPMSDEEVSELADELVGPAAFGSGEETTVGFEEYDGFEEYELCMKCQNSKIIGTECSAC